MCEFCSDFYDAVAIQNAYSCKDIVENLTLENIEQFLRSLGVEEISRYDDYLICPTICHNQLDEATSMKLYYYDKNKSFHCYTQCSENFNVIELYRRYMDINHYKVSVGEAAEYIKQFLQLKFDITPIESKKESKPIKKVDFIELKEKNKNVLDCFTHLYHPLWLEDGIGKTAMDNFGIKFSLKDNKIIIPHYDINGRLVGIRCRNIEEEDIAYGKYMPVKVGDQMYNHQLGFNLYGIYEHKDAIRKTKRAVIFEGEKSVLLSDTYYGKASTAVATCGSSLNKFQINLLVKKLGVNEIILAYDKEYEFLGDEKSKVYRQKLIDKCSKYNGLANFYYVFDERDLLKEKDSPIDRGQEVYEKLISKKIRVR